MYCFKCGNELGNEAIFCNVCGEKQVSSKPKPTNTNQMQQPQQNVYQQQPYQQQMYQQIPIQPQMYYMQQNKPEESETYKGALTAARILFFLSAFYCIPASIIGTTGLKVFAIFLCIVWLFVFAIFQQVNKKSGCSTRKTTFCCVESLVLLALVLLLITISSARVEVKYKVKMEYETTTSNE